MDQIIKDVDTGQPVPKPLPPKKPKAKKILAVLGVLVLIGGAGGGAYYWRDLDAKKLDTGRQTEISNLQSQVTQLQSDVASAKAEASKTAKSSSGPDQDTLDNVEESITSGNTAALESYLASKVMVIIAASEGVGSRTPAQATADVTDYIKDANSPWNFALPEATINDYSSGDYAQYFPSGALVGKSADDMVISFTFNNAGDVSVIFLSASADLL